MQSLEKVCPNAIFNCLRILLVSMNKKLGKKQKSYDGVNQFEEEQFSISFDNFHKEEEQDNRYKMETSQNTTKPSAGSIDNNFDKVGLNYKEQTVMTNSSAISSFKAAYFKQFKINLQPYDQYYDILNNKTQNIESYFTNQHSSIVDLNKGNRPNQSNFEVSQYPSSIGFKFILRYQLPCSYAFYMKTNKSTDIVKSLYDKIATFQLLQTVQPNLQILHLQLKKIMGLGIEPRKFTYLKYRNTCGQVYWETCISVDYQGQQKFNPLQKQSIKAATLFSISHITEKKPENSNEEEIRLFVETYMEVDLHSVLKAERLVNKALMQVKNYVENIYQYSLQNFQMTNDIA